MRNSVTGLVARLREEAKLFVREEIQLAKTEVSEKVTRYGDNAALVAAGGTVAYAGLILFLAGFAGLISFLFSLIGIDPLLAVFAGFGLMGLLVIAPGAALLLKGIQAIRKEALVPEKTVETLQRLKESGAAVAANVAGVARHDNRLSSSGGTQDDRTSEQVADSVKKTQDRAAVLVEEVADQVRQRTTDELRRHPYRWGLLAAGCGAAGSYVVSKRRRH